MEVLLYLDSVLVSFSLFLMLGYHANLWRTFKNKPSNTSIGIDASRRRVWFMGLNEGDDKKGMLAVQSLRNTLMEAGLTAQISILVAVAVAAFLNNAYKATQKLDVAFFAQQSGQIFALKYASASVFLLLSFFFNSMAFCFLIEAGFLMNAVSCDGFSSPLHTQTILERGFLMAVVGNRILCMSFPMLLWMFGPLPVVLASVGLVWGLYEIDFVGSKFARRESVVLLIES